MDDAESTACAKAMRAIVGDDGVLSSPASMRAYDCDAYTIDRSKPRVVVLPRSTDEVSRVVRWCHREGVPYTPRGAGTGLSGGAMAALGGVIVSTKRLDRILQVDVPNAQLLAQTGVPNLALSKAVAAHGLHFAPDPSSQSVSTLGGNIAENSGGPHTLKYGVTTNHVLQVQMVTSEGEVETIGSRVPGGAGPDFLSLVVGSEGTLGVVTEAWVKLTPVPCRVWTALIAFPSVRQATESVSAIIGEGIVPAALEMMDKGILHALRAAFGLEFPSGAQALLLVELDVCDPREGDQGEAGMQRVKETCTQRGALSFRLAADEAERADLWKARKKGIGAMGRLAPTIVTHDGVIPPSKLPEMLEFVESVATKYGLGVANLFHAGDGNLHPCFYFDDREPGVIEKVVAAGEAILTRCIELGGSVSGEHGIGVEKLDLFAHMFTPDDLKLQGHAKSVFSVSALCNPCKVLPNQKGCLEHKTRWRGAAW